MVTIKQIAELAGVSRGTVDRVLNHRGRVAPEKEALIWQLVEQLHYEPSETGRALAAQRNRQQVIFFCVDTQDHPYFSEVNAAAAQQAAALEKLGMDVVFWGDWIYADREETRKWLARTPHSGIVLHGISTVSSAAAAEWAAERNIPVVYYNEPPKGENFLAYVGCDYTQSGRIAAGLCALTGRSSIGIISEGLPSIQSFSNRVNGFRQALQSYPSLRVSDICDLNDMENMLQRSPDIELIYLINPGDYSVCYRIHDLRPDIRIITNDLTEAPRLLLQEGILSATITQDPASQGRLPLEILYQYLFLHQSPEQRIHHTELRIHIREMCW